MTDLATEQPATPETAQDAVKLSLAEEMKANYQKAQQPNGEQNANEVQSSTETVDQGGERSGDTTETSQPTEDSAENNIREESEQEDVLDSHSPEEELAEAVEKEFPLIPNEMSDEEKEAFTVALDSEDPQVVKATEVMLKRYNDLKRGFYAKSKEVAEKTKEMDKAFAPADQILKQRGLTRESYINNILQLEQMMATNPQQGIQLLAQRYGVNLNNAVQSNNNTQDQYGLDEYQPLDSEKDQEINNLKAELKNLQAHVTNLPVQTRIEQFATATDAQGHLMHPKFNEVRHLMGALMQSTPDLTMEEAYQRAIRAADGSGSEATTQSVPDLDIKAMKQKIKKSTKAERTVQSRPVTPDYSQMSIKDEMMARAKQKL